MRFYSALLHLYPASFRSEYGPEMRAIFNARALVLSAPSDGHLRCMREAGR